LTHDVNVMLPLLLSVTVAHGFTVLTLRRSILTEKVSRRGYHLSREYSIDPLEIVLAREVARTGLAVKAGSSIDEIAALERSAPSAQRLVAVVDEQAFLLGVVGRNQLRGWLTAPAGSTLLECIERRPIVAHPNEPLRRLAFRMAETGRTRLPIVDEADGRFLGMVSLADLLVARSRILDAEGRRERVLGSPWPSAPVTAHHEAR
jgi:CBS domain-containing protein